MAPYRSSGEEPKARSAVLKGARRRVRASGDFRFAPSSCDFVNDGGKNALDVGRSRGNGAAEAAATEQHPRVSADRQPCVLIVTYFRELSA